MQRSFQSQSQYEYGLPATAYPTQNEWYGTPGPGALDSSFPSQFFEWYIDGAWQPQYSHKLPPTRHTKISSNAIRPLTIHPSHRGLCSPPLPTSMTLAPAHLSLRSGMTNTEEEATHSPVRPPTPRRPRAARRTTEDIKHQRRLIRPRTHITLQHNRRAHSTHTPLPPRTSRATRPRTVCTLTRRGLLNPRRPGQSPRWFAPPELTPTLHHLTLRTLHTPGTTHTQVRHPRWPGPRRMLPERTQL